MPDFNFLFSLKAARLQCFFVLKKAFIPIFSLILKAPALLARVRTKKEQEVVAARGTLSRVYLELYDLLTQLLPDGKTSCSRGPLEGASELRL